MVERESQGGYQRKRRLRPLLFIVVVIVSLSSPHTHSQRLSSLPCEISLLHHSLQSIPSPSLSLPLSLFCNVSPIRPPVRCKAALTLETSESWVVRCA
jgi:hypothetical protein